MTKASEKTISIFSCSFFLSVSFADEIAVFKELFSKNLKCVFVFNINGQVKEIMLKKSVSLCVCQKGELF